MTPASHLRSQLEGSLYFNPSGEALRLRVFFDRWGDEEAKCAILEVLQADRQTNLLVSSLSRLEPLFDSEWRCKVLVYALASGSESTREYGVALVESWEDPRMFRLLSRHRDPCLWIENYRKQVWDERMGEEASEVGEGVSYHDGGF